MKIIDRVHGTITIDNPLIIELIETPAMQRLKGISQDGAAHLIQPRRNVNRFEHSVGVWYLAKYFKRPLEEQVASLLHDISHTAFSHVIDTVMGNERDEYAESFSKKVVRQSKIPQILGQYGYNLDRIFDKALFPLLNNDLPGLSFDRCDYFFRDGISVNLLPKKFVRIFMHGMKVEQEQLYFSELNLASAFALQFLTCCRLLWMDPTASGSYHLLAKAIKLGLQEQVVIEADFFGDEAPLITKLETARNPEIQKVLDRLAPGKEFTYTDKDSAEFSGKYKSRYVDPLVKTETGLQRVSELTYSVKNCFEEFREYCKFKGVRQLK